VLGIPVDVQPWFWMTAVLFQFSLVTSGRFAELAAWVAVVFVAVLIHELGHALAVRRYKIQPTITLYWMGGLTSWRALLPLGRVQGVIISLAGPFTGFFAGGLVFAAMYLLLTFAPATYNALPPLAHFTLRMFLWANLYWGLFNLIPVQPLDGGHALEHALGPRRERLAAGISFLCGALGALYFFMIAHSMYAGLLLALAALQSLQRFRSEPDPGAIEMDRRPPMPPPEEPIPGELLTLLRRAQRALADEQLDEAAARATEVLSRDPEPPRAAMREAHEVLGWVSMLDGNTKGAAAALAEAKRYGQADAALAAAVARAQGDVRQARRILEDARAAGDDRKEVVGPLIQILIEHGEVPRAAAVALDIIESLSEEDARRMAEIAFEHGSFEWAARLYEAVFRRGGASEDAYAAARASARVGDHDKALAFLRQAVDAGFSDRARAWSDAALEPLRNGPLETVLPRP